MGLTASEIKEIEIVKQLGIVVSWLGLQIGLQCYSGKMRQEELPEIELIARDPRDDYKNINCDNFETI